ncbi:MAG: hypothetical protein WCD89_14285 [Anaerocolumna sp.]
MNREFLNKMKEAKKLEREALKLVLPENVRSHVEVIEKEVKSIFLECITGYMGKGTQEKNNETAKSKLHKVKIN